jgi:hypothetical protein
MRGRHIPLPAALLLGVTVTGCGLTNPYANRITDRAATATHTTITRVTNADPAPERAGTISAAAHNEQTKFLSGAGSVTPELALARYAWTYINWTASTVAAAQARLARVSLDSARAQALQAEASYRRDTTLLRSHVVNRGTVIAVAAGQGSARGSWVVVTRETTTGQGDYVGLPAELHITYAQVTHTPAGWAVSSWRPQT